MQPRPWPAAGRPPLATRGTGEVMTPIENNPPATCPACGCTDAAGAHAHAIAAALIDDDLDRAMTLGLLEPVACSACTDDCSKRLRQAREARSEEHTSELQSLMRISYAVFCLNNKKTILKPHLDASRPEYNNKRPKTHQYH